MKIRLTYSFGFIKIIHTNVAIVLAVEVDGVDGSTHPEVQTWQPDQDGVLKAHGEVWVICVPCQVPVLKA